MKNSNHPLLFLLSFLVPSASWRCSHPGRFFKTSHIPVIFISYYKSFFTFPQKNMTRVRRQKLSNDVFQYKNPPKNEVVQKKRSLTLRNTGQVDDYSSIFWSSLRLDFIGMVVKLIRVNDEFCIFQTIRLFDTLFINFISNFLSARSLLLLQ